MSSILSLLSWIFFGDFGLLTLAPRYLFGVLFPVMIFVGILGEILKKTPATRWFHLIVGLGCTTAALASLDSVKDEKTRHRLLWTLILLIPCSSQIAIIASFAAIVTLRVFLTYLAFVMLILIMLYLCISKAYPLTNHGIIEQSSIKINKTFFLTIIKDAFFSVVDTIPSFSLGSVLISLLMYFGILDAVSCIFAPWLEGFLRLPKEAAGLFILNLFKRDFGSASLLTFAESGAFDAVQLTVVMIMLTFCVPCFNSTVYLFKEKKLPMASFIWMGSLFISLLLGRLVSAILFICTF